MCLQDTLCESKCAVGSKPWNGNDRYVVYPSGYIIDITKGTRVKCYVTPKTRHLGIRLYTKDCVRVSTTLSKVIAETFVSNPDEFKYLTYIDEDPKNCAADNLVWIKQRNSTNQVQYSSVSPMYGKTEIKDIVSGISSFFPSLSAAAKHLHISIQKAAGCAGSNITVSGVRITVHTINKVYTVGCKEIYVYNRQTKITRVYASRVAFCYDTGITFVCSKQFRHGCYVYGDTQKELLHNIRILELCCE